MANLTQAIAQRPPATMHVSQPVVHVTNVATRTTALLTQHPVIPHQPSSPPKLPVPQVHLEPFNKIQASTVTTVSCGKSSIQPTNPGSSANMSLSSAIALESAQKSLSAAKTTGPRLVMHTQEQAAVKAMLDKKALTKTNSPVLVATRQPPSSVPDLSTEVLHKVMSASSAQNKTNSPRTESQAVVTTGTGKQVTQPQTILGTVQSVNAATRAALTPNSGSHSPNAAPHTPPSPPQNLALQPMTPPSAPAPTAAEHVKQQLLQKIDGVYGTPQFDVRMLVGAILKGKLSKDDVLGWARKRMVESNVVSALVTYKAISQEDSEIWQKQSAAKKITATSSKTASLTDKEARYQQMIARAPSKEVLLQYLKKESAKREVLELHEYSLPLEAGKLTLQDMIDNGIINRAQAETLREAFLPILPAYCLQITSQQNNSALLASSSSAVSTTRTSAGNVKSSNELHDLNIKMTQHVPAITSHVQKPTKKVSVYLVPSDHIQFMYLLEKNEYVGIQAAANYVEHSLQTNANLYYWDDQTKFVILKDKTFAEWMEAINRKVES